MLSAEKLSFSYGKCQVLEEVNLSAHPGEVISLIGPNGSGKSTLLRCLCGLLRPRRNSVFLQGQPIEKLGPREIARRVAFLPQFQQSLPGVTVYELVAMGRAPYHRSGWVNTREDRDQTEWAIEYMQIGRLTHRKVDTLSGGERQRAWIAMVLAQDTPVVLLDEPVTYMDLRHQCELLGTVQDLRDKFKKTVIAVFHDINHAIEISDSVCLMQDGRVYRVGTSEQVITEQSIRDVYGVSAHICRFHRCCRNVVVPAGAREKTPGQACTQRKII